MNCDRIAPFYRIFETAAFGRRLQKHRLVYLTAAAEKRRALILGDGDGRFTEVLTRAYPNLQIDSLELSAGMIAEARKRLTEKENLRLTRGDALEFSFSSSSYDVVFTHFFLDCFNMDKLTALITRLAEALTPDAVWIVSDFRQAPAGWRKLYSQAWLFTMYRFFKFATGLRTQRMPNYGDVLELAGFKRRKEHISADGLLASEWWQRQPVFRAFSQNLYPVTAVLKVGRDMFRFEDSEGVVDSELKGRE